MRPASLVSRSCLWAALMATGTHVTESAGQIVVAPYYGPSPFGATVVLPPPPPPPPPPQPPPPYSPGQPGVVWPAPGIAPHIVGEAGPAAQAPIMAAPVVGPAAQAPAAPAKVSPVIGPAAQMPLAPMKGLPVVGPPAPNCVMPAPVVSCVPQYYLGITGTVVNVCQPADGGRWELGPGVSITSVTSSTPAWGRLNPGDVIVRVNGMRVRSVDELVAVLQGAGRNGQATLTVRDAYTGCYVNRVIPLQTY